MGVLYGCFKKWSYCKLVVLGEEILEVSNIREGHCKLVSNRGQYKLVICKERMY
jgi:hypothetical protein